MLRAQPITAKPTILAITGNINHCAIALENLERWPCARSKPKYIFRFIERCRMQNHYANLAKNNIQTSIFPSIYGIPSTYIPCFGMKRDELDIWIDLDLLANSEITGECFPLIPNTPEKSSYSIEYGKSGEIALLLLLLLSAHWAPTPSWILSANFAWNIREELTHKHTVYIRLFIAFVIRSRPAQNKWLWQWFCMRRLWSTPYEAIHGIKAD